MTSENPLLKKLRLSAGMRTAIVNAPEGYIESLNLPNGINLTAGVDEQADFVQFFVRDSAELAQLGLPDLDKLKPDCILWFCYPKLSSGVKSDLTRDAGWQILTDAGWRGVASIAIDDTWSGVRFRPGSWDAGAEGLDAQYAGAKAALRPIYDRILAIVRGFGDDVESQTRKTYVAFARGKQFAVVQPTTKTRIDIGLKLPGAIAGGRLEPATNTGSGSMTHKISVTSLDEVDEYVESLLLKAYESSA